MTGHVLVLRAWQDEGDVRARLLGVGAGTADGSPVVPGEEVDERRTQTLTVAQGPDAICDLVRTWLAGLPPA